MATTVHNLSSCHTPHCCDQTPTSTNPNLELFMRVLEKVCLVGLGALAIYANWQVFIPFFLIGGAIGVYSYLQDKDFSQYARAAASCTQGVLEQISGVKLPAPVALATNAAITACHVVHHGVVFVPVVALCVGAYVGKGVSHGVNWLSKEISVHASGTKTVLA